MKKLCLAVLCAASTLACLKVSAEAADCRQLNHEAVQAIKSGDYERAEELLMQALSVYTPEPDRFDMTINNNLNVLRQHKTSVSRAKVSSGTGSRLYAQLTETANQSLESFAQPYFERIAAQILKGQAKVLLGPSNVRRLGYGDYELRYRTDSFQGRTFEITARVQKLADGNYKILEIHSDNYRPVNFQANNEKWDLLASHSDSATKASLSAREAVSASKELETSVESDPQLKLKAENGNLQVFEENSGEKLKTGTDSNPTLETETSSTPNSGAAEKTAATNTEEQMKAAAVAATNQYAYQLMVKGALPPIRFG